MCVCVRDWLAPENLGNKHFWQADVFVLVTGSAKPYSKLRSYDWKLDILLRKAADLHLRIWVDKSLEQ